MRGFSLWRGKKKTVTYTEKEKARINPVTLNQNQRYNMSLWVYTHIYTNKNEYKGVFMHKYIS